jgi:hypothetical protein
MTSFLKVSSWGIRHGRFPVCLLPDTWNIKGVLQRKEFGG